MTEPAPASSPASARPPPPVSSSAPATTSDIGRRTLGAPAHRCSRWLSNRPPGARIPPTPVTPPSRTRCRALSRPLLLHRVALDAAEALGVLRGPLRLAQQFGHLRLHLVLHELQHLRGVGILLDQRLEA